MVKKLFTLVAFLAVVMGAKAEWVEDYKIDYSTYQDFPFYIMGYAPIWVDGVMTDIAPDYSLYRGTEDEFTDEMKASAEIVTINGSDYYKVKKDGIQWHQYFIADGIPTEIDGTYTVTAMVKASEACSVNVNMGNWSGSVSKSFNIGTEWAEVEVEFSGITCTSCFLVAQPGGFAGTIEWKWVKVGHNAKAQRPTEWIPLLENGDAEKAWTEIVPAGAATPANDPDNIKVCAWSKEFMAHMTEDGLPENDPYPCSIEDDGTGNHVFVVHAKKVDANDFAEGGQYYEKPGNKDVNAMAWMNQFWIESPKEWKGGEKVKISFRYKASQQTAAVNTQCHAATPGSYLHWAAIGDVTFTTEWQTFEKEVDLPSQGKGMYSIAFNLGSNDNYKDDIDFYFDDLYWGEMKLDHGFFVAGCNTKNGLEYDLDNAIEMVYDEEEGAYKAVLGEKGKPETYVDQVMVSTVRGNDAMFKSNTLSVSGSIVSDEGEWPDYTEKAIAKLNLPGSGVWQIMLDNDALQMNFQMLEGEVKEPIEVVANTTEIKVEALERNELKPEGAGDVDDNGNAWGNTWDNQMWIVANRALEAGEVTYLEFKYKADKAAKASTQCHGEPGGYIHWAAIGDVNFTEDWQTFEMSFPIPSECAGKDMKSIAFNLAEMKEANNYYIKDVIWVVGSKDESYESLISTTGDQHIAWKVVGGAIVVGDPSGIESVVAAPVKKTGLYNLAGQKVDKNYKGIVIKDGNKIIVK